MLFMTYNYNKGVASSSREKHKEALSDTYMNIEQYSNNPAVRKAAELSAYYCKSGNIDVCNKINKLASSLMRRLRNISSAMPIPGYFDGKHNPATSGADGQLLSEDGFIIAAENNIGILL